MGQPDTIILGSQDTPTEYQSIKHGNMEIASELEYATRALVSEPKLNFNAKQTDWIADIAAMHTKFGVNAVLRDLDEDKLRTWLKFRIDFLQEELDEMIDAKEAEDVVDALIDLCVVAIGTLNGLDVDAYEAWNRVHEKNMQKNAGINKSRPNPLGLPDLIKPPGWTAPTHADNVGLLSKVF